MWVPSHNSEMSEIRHSRASGNNGIMSRESVIPIAKSNDLFTTRHPGEGRGPVPRLAERKNWIPAFAGMTVQAASNWTKLLATAIRLAFRRLLHSQMEVSPGRVPP